MSAAAYRARSATELIDATFQLLRRNAAAFYTLSAMFSITNAIVATILVPGYLTRSPISTTTAVAGFGNLALYFLFIMAAGAVLYTAMTIASGDAYLGRPVTAASALQRGMPKALPVFIGYLLSGFLLALAFVIGIIIGGIIVGLMFFAVTQVIVFEDAQPTTALSRSSALSKGLKGHIFLTFFLAGVIISVANIIVLVIGTWVGTASTTLQLIIQALLQTILIPIYPLFSTLLYYDARIRKEGYDIELMAQQVGGAPASATKPQPA